MTQDLEPISKLELWQFSLNYDDLPFMEDTREPVDNGIYRSRQSRYVYVWHAGTRQWDCFVGV